MGMTWEMPTCRHFGEINLMQITIFYIQTNIDVTGKFLGAKLIQQTSNFFVNLAIDLHFHKVPVYHCEIRH